MTQNPNWPLVDEAVSFQSGPNSPAPFPYWCSVIGRTEGQWTSRRGRQYEVDQVQAGTVTSTLRNDDAAFDPSNTSSPFYPQVTPWRGYRRRMQLPATVNLLTADQATVFYASKGAYSGSTLPQWVGTITGSAISIHANGSSNYYAVTVPASRNFETVAFYGFSVTPGQAYTGQCGANCSTGVTAQVALRFVDVNGNTLTQTLGGSTTSATGAVITVTATAPSNAAGGYLYVQNTTAAASAGQFNVWNVQVEANASASAWAQPGTWYDIFTGFVERWPQSWTDGGTYGVSQLTCVDAIAYLSQRRLRSPAYMEALAMGPSWLYPLDEGSNAAKAVDLTHQQPPVPLAWTASHEYGGTGAATTIQTLAFGADLSLATGETGWVPGGIGGPCLQATSTGGNPPVWTYQYLDMTGGGQRAAGPVTSKWTRVFAFYAPVTAAFANSGLNLFKFGTSAYPGYPYVRGEIGYDSNGNPGNLVISAADTSNIKEQGWNLTEGWHLLAVGMDFTTNTLSTWLDGVPGTVLNNPATTIALGEFSFDYLAADDYTYGPGNTKYAFYCEFPWLFSNSDATRIYSAVRYGGSGSGTASSGTRYADILRWAQWAGESAVDTYTTGECNTYGPSTDLLASVSEPGTDGVSACQTVVDTDDGEQFVDRSGVVTFHARRWRFNQTVPAVTFGDGTGEIPYTDCSFGLDPTRLANDAAITQTSTQTTVTVLDTASIAAYGDVQLQRHVNDTNTESLDDMAQYLATHYATPVQRLETLRIEPATYTVNGAPSTAAWQACLSLELGTPVAINRRPPGVPTIGFTGFVEQINWTMDDQGRAVCELQVSPNYGKQFWQLDSPVFSVLGTSTICGY